MSEHPSPRDQHAAHRDEQIRVNSLRRSEQHARTLATSRAVRALVQPHEPHHFHACSVEPISPRRAPDHGTAPGGADHTGFRPEGAVC